MDILFLLAVLAGMNANQYNAYEGPIWQHTGKVFKISCVQYKFQKLDFKSRRKNITSHKGEPRDLNM